MSFRAIVWAFDQIRAGRSPSASSSLVLLKLADRANDDGECWPGQERIGADISLSDETVRQCCRRLEDVTLVEIVRRKDAAGRDISNLYRLIGFGGGESQNSTTPTQNHKGRTQNPNSRPQRTGGKPIKVNLSVNPTTTGGGADIDDLVEAALWAAGNQVSKPGSYRAAVRRRLHATPPTSDDLTTLAAWRTAIAARQVDELAANLPAGRWVTQRGSVVVIHDTGPVSITTSVGQVIAKNRAEFARDLARGEVRLEGAAT